MKKICSKKAAYRFGITTLLGCVLISASPSFANSDKLFREPVVIDTNKIKDDLSLTPRVKAEKLALVGEILVNPTGFMYADKIFSEALALDPKNSRAQFYKAFLGSSMQLKGILKRVEPLIKSEDASTRKEYEELVNPRMSYSGLQEFLLDGQANIGHESQIQKFLDGFRDEQNKFRLFLKKNSNLSLTLNFSRVRKVNKARAKAMWKKCYSKEVAKDTYLISACPYMVRQTFRVERADVEVLRHLAAGIQLYTIAATSYDATGGLRYRQARRDGWQPNDQQTVRYFEQIERSGKLRDTTGLKLVSSMASDIFAGAKWAYSLQDSLCPKGSGSINRPGYLVSSGVCIEETATGKIETIFKTLEIALGAQAIDIFVRNGKPQITALAKDTSGGIYRTRTNILAPFINPVVDLKVLLPTRFNECGNATNVGEATLAGLLPGADADNFLTATGNINRKCR